jgi:hypothetical protein
VGEEDASSSVVGVAVGSAEDAEALGSGAGEDDAEVGDDDGAAAPSEPAAWAVQPVARATAAAARSALRMTDERRIFSPRMSL